MRLPIKRARDALSNAGRPCGSTSALLRGEGKRRRPKPRVGKVRARWKVNLRSAKGAEEALCRWARWDLLWGRSARAAAQVNLDAFPAIELRCRAAPAGDQARGITKALIAGARLIRDRLERALAEAPEGCGPPPSAEVARAWKFLRTARRSVELVFADSPSVDDAQLFGLHMPVFLDAPCSVADACDWMASGYERQEGTLADRLLLPSEIEQLRRWATNIRAEQDVLRPPQGEETSAAQERRMLNVALEIFYDMYGAAAGLWFKNDAPERRRALSLIPRGAQRQP